METQIINITGVMLGIISPVVFLYVLSYAVRKASWSEEKRKTYWRNLVMGVVGWTAVVFLLTFVGAFEYAEADILPRFLVGLLLPVTIMLVLFFRKSFGELLKSMPLHSLIGAQFFRLFGAVFLLVAMSGMGPYAFVSSGYGDILTGLIALIASALLFNQHRLGIPAAWLFTIVGMLDLVNVSRILLMNYPKWSNADPSTAIAGAFPLMLIIGITAPVALLLHIYTLKGLLHVSKVLSP
jgi:hypothetical protein